MLATAGGLPGSQAEPRQTAALAPVLDPVALGKARLIDLAPGTVDWCLKCSAGPFQGKFLYPDADGELFGSDGESDQVSMLIEHSDLAPLHASVERMGK